MVCNGGHYVTMSLRHSQSSKSPLLPLRFIWFRIGRVKEGLLWSLRVLAGQGKFMRVMDGPWGSFRVHKGHSGSMRMMTLDGPWAPSRLQLSSGWVLGGLVMVFLWWLCRVHESHFRSIRVIQDPWGPWRFNEVQGGFNEVLVGTLEGLEIKEGSIRVIVFHEGYVGSMRVLLGLWGSSWVHELQERSINVWLGSWIV